MDQDPPKAAVVVALDIILNKRTVEQAALAIERYRNEAPPDPPHLSARAFAAILPALVAGVPPQEHAPLPASADDIVREIATFLEEDEEVVGETIHARIARAARMLAKFQGRYVLTASKSYGEIREAVLRICNHWMPRGYNVDVMVTDLIRAILGSP